MTLPRINWTKVAENLAASDPYAAMLLADGSIGTRQGETLLTPGEAAEFVERQARYESWCRRGGRTIHPIPAPH